MTSEIRDGDIVQHLAGSNIASGDVVVIGNRVGIAIADIASGSSGAVKMVGCYSVTKVSAQAWAAGDEIFWDASASKFTTVGTANTFAGHAMDIAANPTASGNLRLSPGYKKSTVIAAVATADGSDAATTQALANSLKASHNALLAALKVAGLMANS